MTIGKIRLSSLLFLAPAAALSLIPLPDDAGAFPVVILAFLRAIALFVGLIGLLITKRLDRWPSTPVRSVILFVIGVGVLFCNLLAWQIMNSDFLPEPYATIYLVFIYTLPILLMASVFVPSKLPFISCVVFTFLAGIVFLGLAPDAEKTYPARREAAARARNDAEMAAWNAKVDARMADLSRVAPDAGPEPLLAFVGGDEPEKVRNAALARLSVMPNVVDQLAHLLDGDHALNGLYGLSFALDKTFEVPEPIQQRGWIVAGTISRDMMQRLGQSGATFNEGEIDKFCRTMAWLTQHGVDAAMAIRVDHRAELLAVRDWRHAASERTSHWCGEGASLDRILAAP